MKTVLVTGASRGLGLAIAGRLLQDGFRVVASGRTPSKEFESLAADHPNDLAFMPFDLSRVDQIHEFVGTIAQAHGPLFGLVNNAGIGCDGVLPTMHNSQIEQVLRVNTLAPIILTKYVSRRMIADGQKGRIVNVSSVVARTGYSGLAAYAASKAALEGFTHSLARELGRMGITVNAVAPGYAETDMTQGLTGDKLEQIRRRSALRSLICPEDVAGAISYLLGPDGVRVTGTVVTVDAGNTA